MIDSHCHIHDFQFFPDNREDVYVRAKEAGMGMIVVGTSEADSQEAVEFAAAHDGVWAVVGVHPHDTKDGWGRIKQILDKKYGKIVGIGEIGLDYFYNHSPKDTQIRALEEQLQLASDYNLPVSFHVREAYEDFWPIFDNFPRIRGVLHCFTDTEKTMNGALKRNLYFGVNGISTFTKDVNQQAMFTAIPLEKILLETDAPFLTPRPFRGKMNEPVYVVEVAKHLAEMKNVPLDTVLSVTTANTQALFNL